jgi:hypothetical protein
MEKAISLLNSSKHGQGQLQTLSLGLLSIWTRRKQTKEISCIQLLLVLSPSKQTLIKCICTCLAANIATWHSNFVATACPPFRNNTEFLAQFTVLQNSLPSHQDAWPTMPLIKAIPWDWETHQYCRLVSHDYYTKKIGKILIQFEPPLSHVLLKVWLEITLTKASLASWYRAVSTNTFPESCLDTCTNVAISVIMYPFHLVIWSQQ